MVRTSLFRFFIVVSPPPRWVMTALVLVTVSGCVTLWLNPVDVDSALGPILLLQMFAASSGFTYAAARGHFDSVLVDGHSRIRVALASFAAAAAPGACAWTTVSACAALFSGEMHGAEPNRWVALWLVSGVGWGIGTALPRLAAGAAWSMLLVGLALSRGPLPDLLLLVKAAPATLTQAVSVSGVCIACPFLLLSEFPATRSLTVLAFDMFGGLAVICAASAYLCRREYALQDPT